MAGATVAWLEALEAGATPATFWTSVAGTFSTASSSSASAVAMDVISEKVSATEAPALAILDASALWIRRLFFLTFWSRDAPSPSAAMARTRGSAGASTGGRGWVVSVAARGVIGAVSAT